MTSDSSKQPRQPASIRPQRGPSLLQSPMRTLWVAAALLLLLAAACTDTSPVIGRHHQGRTLNISVVAIEQVPELIYATIDPEEVVRQWRLTPSSEGLELVMVRLQVQNHKAVNAVFNVDKAAALLRDITNQEYLPLTISESVRRDLRGESPATVRMALGQCFDSERMVVDAGAEVHWVNEGEAGQFLQFNATDFEAGTNPLPGQDGRVEIPVGGSFSQTFGAQGVFDYECGNADLTSPAHLLVEGTDGKSNTKGRAVVFLNGPFELPRGHGLDGWMVFEAPPDTRFRDFRWRAGDSITIRF